MNAFEYPTIHYTELPAAEPGTPLFSEWETYRRLVSGLLADGQEGRWALIKGEDLVGIWDTHDEALHEGVTRYGRSGFMIHEILTREPILRGPIFRTCQG